ncbi:MAG: carboxypeptidase-like regulatory domain-containing protein [Leptolyngbyaceae cyanobacterium]
MARSQAYFGDLLLPLMVALGLWGQAQTAQAHGAHIQANEITAVEIEATYDSGEPMAEAGVEVYDPTDPQTPRFTGQTDRDGRFSFTPDQSGDWEVTVRQAGHGAIAVIPVSGDGTITAAIQTNTPLTPLQRGLMAGAVTWGCVGTALYFWRGKR